MATLLKKHIGRQGKAGKSTDALPIVSPPPQSTASSSSRARKEQSRNLNQIGSFAFLPESQRLGSSPGTSPGSSSSGSPSSPPSPVLSSPLATGSSSPRSGSPPSPPLPASSLPQPHGSSSSSSSLSLSTSSPASSSSWSSGTPSRSDTAARSISPHRAPSPPIITVSDESQSAAAAAAGDSGSRSPRTPLRATPSPPWAAAAEPSPAEPTKSLRETAWRLDASGRQSSRSCSPPAQRQSKAPSVGKDKDKDKEGKEWRSADQLEELCDPAVERLCLQLAPISDEDRQIAAAFSEHLLPLLALSIKFFKNTDPTAAQSSTASLWSAATSQSSPASTASAAATSTTTLQGVASSWGKKATGLSTKIVRRLVSGLTSFVLALSKATAHVATSQQQQAKKKASIGQRNVASVRQRAEEPTLPTPGGDALPVGRKVSDKMQRRAVPWPSVFYSYVVATRSTFSVTEESQLVRLTDEYLRYVDQLPADMVDPYVLPQMRQLRQFLECDGRLRVDLCNSLIGLEIPQKVVFDFHLSSSARCEIPRKSALLDTIQQWSQISDPFALQRRVVALANEIRRSSFQTAKSEFVLVRLDGEQHSDGEPAQPARFFFGRISSQVDGDNININLDPRERYKNSRTVKTSQICFLEASAIRTFLEGNAATIATFVVDPVQQLIERIASLEKLEVNRLLTSHGIDPMVLMLLRSPDWTDAPVRLHSALHACARTLQDRSVLPVSAFAAIDSKLYALWEQSVERLAGTPTFLAGRALEKSVERALRYRSESSSSRILGEFLGNATKGLAVLADKVAKIESGAAKSELVNWWLELIHDKTEEFLSALPGWRAPTNQELLGDKMPDDFNALSHSLRVVTALLDLNHKSNLLRRHMVDWIQKIYVRIDAFIQDLRATIALSVGVPLDQLSVDRLAATLQVFAQLRKQVGAESQFKPGTGVSLEQVFDVPKLHASFKGYLADADLIAQYQCYQKCRLYLSLLQPPHCNRQQLRDLASDLLNEYAKPQSIMSVGLPADTAGQLMERLHSTNWDTAPLPFLESTLEPLTDFCEQQLIARVDTFLQSPFYAHFRRYVERNLFQSARERLPDYLAAHPDQQLYDIASESQHDLLVARLAEHSYLEQIKKLDDRFVASVQCDVPIEADKDPVLGQRGLDQPVPIAGIIINRFARYQQDLTTLCDHWKIAV